MEPMLLSPAGKGYLWGGTRLKTEYNKSIDMFPLAETWECSIHPDGLSTVRHGAYSGWKLSDVLKQHPEYLGKRAPNELPVLVKLIDAEQDLSIQVHPDDGYARKYENDNGKIEMWYVLDAKPGAKLVYGFAHNIAAHQLKEAVESGTLSKHLQYISVKKGDVFLIPPGIIHAIGAGILLVEIQESSNVTYRLYDYNRYDINGKQRTLQLDKAIEVLNMQAEKGIRQKQRFIRYFPGYSREILGRCKYFEVERIQIAKEFSFAVSENSYQILLCIDGCGELEVLGHRYSFRFQKGDCMFLPAALGCCNLRGKAISLKIRQ